MYHAPDMGEDTLLILETEDGAVRHLRLGDEIRLGGSGPGSVEVPGLVSSAAVIRTTPDGPLLEPLGHATILVNDRPPPLENALRPGDTVVLGPLSGRVATLPRRTVVETEGLRAVEAPAPAVPTSLPFDPAPLLAAADEEELETRLLGALLDLGGGGAAAMIGRGLGDGFVTRSVRPDEGSDLPVRSELVEHALASHGPEVVGLPDGPFATLVLVPSTPEDPSGLLLALWSERPPESFTAGDLGALASFGTTAGAALALRRRGRGGAASHRMAAIGRAMAGVAHDMKNLVTGLRTGVFYLDDVLTDHEEPRVREAWRILKGAQTSIQALVTDMVAYGKPEMLSPEPADLVETVAKAVDLLRERAREKGVRLDLEASGSLPATFDARAIERSVVNLVGNALDAAPSSSGTVVVRLEEDERGISIAVSDDGPGVREEDRERIFDLLYTTKGARGSGFGLAITRRIAEGHGGSVELATGSARGATFVLRIPRR
jgi:signal transduction histidine kinase